jgi:GcvH upstream region-like protein
MLSFFRKYQRFFFLVITVVIVISFSLFGTYNTLLKETSYHEQNAFTAIDGKKVSRTELDQMAIFLATDTHDKAVFSGAWGPNFLNDGVIVKNFLQTGLGTMLAASYQQEVAVDLQPRLEKEKRYVNYAHPTASFISAENAWNYFAPEIKNNLQELREESKAESPEAFSLRANLYLAERQFPAQMLRQVLHYQERQYGWVTPDQNLDRTDLALFGYHTLEDWFGPRFTRLVAEFVINSAKIAEARGYKVSREEAMVDLLRNAELSFQQNLQSPYLGVKSPSEYFNEQLRLMNMDQQQATKVWQQVLLFRRLFQDAGDSLFVDTLEHKKIGDYALETAVGELYQLPEELRLAYYKDLQAFEVYLSAVSKRGNDLLALPTTFLTAQEVEKQNPELVQRRYLLAFSHFDKKNLQAKVSIKDTWKWETEEKNWEALKAQFPELAMKKTATNDERFAALESLDSKTRQKIDSYARERIIDAHPEWIANGLAQAAPKKMAVNIPLKWGKTPFIGLTNNEELIALLDSDTPAAKDKLNSFTADKSNYYRIRLIDRDPTKQLLTYAEAKKEGSLDKLVKKKLDADYLTIRDGRASEFQKADKSWKPIDEVQDQVADHYFEKVLKAIREANKEYAGPINGDFYASHRLYSYVSGVQSQIRSDPSKAASLLTQPAKSPESADKLAASEELKNQWRLNRVDYRLSRSESSKRDPIKADELLALASKGWSKVYAAPSGNIVFFQLEQKTNEASPEEIASKVEETQQIVGNEAQRYLMGKMLNAMQEKKAISLDYLNQNVQ